MIIDVKLLYFMFFKSGSAPGLMLILINTS